MAPTKIPRKGKNLKERTAQIVLDTLRANRRRDVLRNELLRTHGNLIDAKQRLKFWEKLQKKGVLHSAASKERDPVAVAKMRKEVAHSAYEIALKRRRTQLASNKKDLLALESKAAIALTKWAFKNRPGRSKKKVKSRK